MKVSAYWIIYKQNTNIKCPFEHSCVFPQWCTPLRKDTGAFESFGRFIIVLLDKTVTITLYICDLYIHIYIYTLS